MINVKNISILTLSTFTLTACASNPDIKFNYHLAETDVNVKVTRTATCDLNENLFVASSAEITPTHRAGNDVKSFNLSNLSGNFANTDITLSLYEDGRLKGINSTSTGQGEAIISSALRVAGFVFGGGFTGILSLPGASAINPSCAFINGGKTTRDKTVTMTFETKLNLNSSTPQIIPATVETNTTYQNLKSDIGEIYYQLGKLNKPTAPVTLNSPQTGAVRLEMRHPALQSFSIYSSKNGTTTDMIWDDRVSIAQNGTDYKLPITKAELFGKQTFSMEVASSGAITKLGYGNETGISQAFNSVDNITSELSGSTTAEKAAGVKAEADLIAQQQRLVRCQADPATCA